MAVPGVVGTLMTNLGVELALRARGIDVVRASVGDRYVLEESRRGWQLGGEGSGHLLALDKHTTGDGIVSALMVLQAAVRSGRSLAELLSDVSCYAQTLINVRLAAGRGLAGERQARRAPRPGRPRARRRGQGADPAVGDGAGGPRDGRGAKTRPIEALRRAAGSRTRLTAVEC